MNLKPCPACGPQREMYSPVHGLPRGPLDDRGAYVQCMNLSCLLRGPIDDPHGAKWNALPRRDDGVLWTEGPILCGAELDAQYLVEYFNAEDGGSGLGIAYNLHDMAGAPFLQLTDGGDIPAHWVTRHAATGFIFACGGEEGEFDGKA